MKEEDVKAMRSYMSGLFKETWGLIGNTIGEPTDDAWQAIIDKSSEWTFHRILSPYEYEKLSIKDQIQYTHGKLLYDYCEILKNTNKQLRNWDGGNEVIKGAVYVPKSG